MAPLSEFFTPERLDYFRDLHEQYPLWCGRWPDQESVQREAAKWSPHIVSQDVIDGAPALYFSYDFRREASEGFAPRPTFYVDDYDHPIPQTGDPSTFITDEIEPPILSALAAAANYVFVPWGTDLPKYGRSAERSAGKRPEEVLAEAAHREVLRRANEITRAQTLALRAWRSRDRADASEELQRIWMEIGRQAGVLPRVKGGLQCTLTDDFLAELHGEAKELCAELVSYDPDDEMLRIVRCLAGGDSALPELDRDLLASMQRQDNPQHQIDQLREKKIDQAIDSTLWARRLAFPMLNEAEIEDILQHTAGKKNKKMIARAALELLAGRLPIVPKTLSHRIARAKQ